MKFLLLWSWRAAAWVFIFLSLLITLLQIMWFSAGSNLNLEHIVLLFYISSLLCVSFVCLDTAIGRLLFNN